jgi:hypothetical protein
MSIFSTSSSGSSSSAARRRRRAAQPEVGGAELVAGRHQHGALEHVIELADVPGQDGRGAPASRRRRSR